MKKRLDDVTTAVPKEADEQKRLVQWFNANAPGWSIDPRLLMHPSNEGNRSRAHAQQLQSMGMRAGTPDLFLAVPRDGFGGLWIEMKRTHGYSVSPAQRSMIVALQAAGYRAEVAIGATMGMQIISDYLFGAEQSANVAEQKTKTD